MNRGLSALDRKLLRDMWRRRGQILAIAAVIAAAVATLLMALSAWRSLADARETYYDRYRFPHVFVNLKRAPDSVAARLGDIPGVADVDTRVTRFVTIDMPGVDEPLRGLALSLSPRPDVALGALVLRQGRWPEPDEGNQILLHEAFATARGLKPGSTFAAVMNGRRVKLTVAGIALSPEYIYVIGPGDLVPDDQRYGVFWMQAAALEATMNYEGAFNEAVLLLRRDASVDAVIAAVDRILAPYGSTGAYARDQQASHAFLDSELDQLRTMAGIIPPIFLLVAAFLLYTVIARQIETQREEIGLLKAFGYSDAAVGWHFIKFALLVSAVGLLLGVAAGGWFGYQITDLYREYFRFPVLHYRIAGDILLLSAVVAVVASSGGALVASLKAMRLTPAVAMAPPRPAVYRRSVFERAGLIGKVRATAYMVVRHIARFPARAAVTVVGIALSLALLISTLQFLDSIDVMIESYFFRAQRQDVTLRFTELQGAAVAAEVARLPGVLRSELRRGVGVRLVHGPRSRRAYILGVDANAELSQQVDVQGRALSLPPSGLVLSERLAAHLDLGVGDRVEVQVLDGHRARASVQVNRIIREYVGLSAYMDRSALNRLTGDGEVADAAWLSIDSTFERALFDRVKRTPGIFTVTMQRQAYGKFRDLLDQNIVTMLGFYVGFAAVIAFGVAYNASRITFSERAHELATLRVLGYHKTEVAWILIGELALLTLVALVLGCGIGYLLSWLMIALFTTDLYQMPFGLAPPTYAWSMLVVLLSTAISCAIVAWRVRNLDLVRVLKVRD